jgi:hypothetical protein
MDARRRNAGEVGFGRLRYDEAGDGRLVALETTEVLREVRLSFPAAN